MDCLVIEQTHLRDGEILFSLERGETRPEIEDVERCPREEKSDGGEALDLALEERGATGGEEASEGGHLLNGQE